VTGRADLWIRRTTTGCIALLALIAGTVSYLHMHLLVERHGQPGWVAALTPLSVDGISVAVSLSHDVAPDAPTEGFRNTSPWVWCSLSSLIRSPAIADPPHVQHLTWRRRVVDHGSTRMIREDVPICPCLTRRE